MPRLELYSVKYGSVQEKGGLNWGLANAHVTTQDAYIALTRLFLDTYPDFFPPHGSLIEVEWDDGELMTCLLEGTQGPNKELPKQISSYDDKSILGSYLRYRLGVSPNHLITMQDLQRYGRDYIDVEYLGENRYFFDFS